MTLEFEKFWIVGTYVPNAGDGLKVCITDLPSSDILTSLHDQNMDRKEAWHSVFEAHLRKLDATKPVIWAGDLNVAPTAKGVFTKNA